MPIAGTTPGRRRTPDGRAEAAGAGIREREDQVAKSTPVRSSTAPSVRPRWRRSPPPHRGIGDHAEGRAAADRGLGTFRLDVLEALAHEIRTPMTTVYGATKMLGSDTTGLSTAQRAEMLVAVELEADRLYRLLEDFFAVAGIADSLRSIGEPVLVQHVVRDVIGDVVPALGDRRIHAVLPPGTPPVRGDVDGLAHAARNLIERAVDASPERGTVEVILRVARSCVAVHVYDRGRRAGPGGEHAFVPFEASAADVAVAPGHVRGLAASRALIEAMDGWTWSRARPEGGTETGFALPLYARDRGSAASRRRHEPRRRPFALRRRTRRRPRGTAAPPAARQAS